MRNLLVFAYSIQVFFALSNTFALQRNERELINEYPQAEVYIDHPLDMEEAEIVDRLPLEEDPLVRTKRALKYKVIESAGLRSHFRPIQDDELLKINPHKRRFRRSTARTSKSELHSDEVEDLDNVDSSKRNEGSDLSMENAPNAQRQIGNPAHYRSDDSRTMDKWVKAPYGDFQSRARKDEEDSHGEQSTNVGIKQRQARVNFITQQGQGSGSGNKDDVPIDGPEARDQPNNNNNNNNGNNNNNNGNSGNNNNNSNGNKYDNKQGNQDDSYRKPLNDRYFPPPAYSTYDRPPAQYPQQQYPSQHYPSYYNRDYPQAYPQNGYYDKYNPYDKYSPYDKYNPYDKFYDRYPERNPMMPPNGMSRMTPPGGPSSSFYYRHQYNEYDDYLPRSVPQHYYSDKRFDMPLDPREVYDGYRPYLGNNEVNNRPGRIVYYANLPEVVRTPSNYRYATGRYADSSNYHDSVPSYYYDRDDYSARTAKSVNYRDAPASTTMRVSSTPLRSGTARDGSFYG